MSEAEWLEKARWLIEKNQPTMEMWTFPQTLAVWLRDGGKCVYCPENLLDRRELTYYYSSIDHLLPKGERKYPGFATAFWNQVLCCRSCNGIKRDWDPSNGQGHSIIAEPSEALRQEWIERARQHIREERDRVNDRFTTERELIFGAMQSES